MISALYFINPKGDVIISRNYRDDVTRAAAEAFRTKVIAAKETGSQPPVRLMDNTSFVYVKHSDIFVVAMTRSNANAAMALHFLTHTVSIFKGYFGEEFDEAALRDNFTLVYELLDEILDHGYPQNSALDVLQLYINLGEQKKGEAAADQANITAQITGAIDWRKEGIFYHKNEVYIDVVESVNLSMSATGTILSNNVTGAVQMKSMLSGMPECKFGINDKLLRDNDQRPAGAKKRAAVSIDDITFHRCVRLKKFGADRTISFTPPDGEFELMRYRIKENVNLPFRIISTIEQQSSTSVVYNVKVVANFSHKLFATNVEFRIPVPPNTARCKVNATSGRAKTHPESRSLVWKIRRFPGGSEAVLSGQVTMLRSASDKQWNKPPITAQFQVPMFTASGLCVRFLKVFERKENYSTTKWVRYITKAGDYQIRI